MKVYKIESDDKLIRLNEKKLKLEKDIQKIIEGNLNLIFNLEFIETEFSIKNRRIDTLAYDFETESFVIIEYKRDKSKSIVDQGYAYLGLLREYQANFVLKYNEIKRANKLINNFDWSQSKIIFIANRFLEYSKEAVGSNMPFELWEISKFEEDILILTKVEPKYSTGIEDVSQVKPSGKKIKKEVQVDEIEEKEVLEDIIQKIDAVFTKRKSPIEMKELFKILDTEIMQIDDVNFKTTTLDLVYQTSGMNFLRIRPRSKDLYIMTAPDYYDGVVKLADDSQIDNAMIEIKKSYELIKKKRSKK